MPLLPCLSLFRILFSKSFSALLPVGRIHFDLVDSNNQFPDTVRQQDTQEAGNRGGNMYRHGRTLHPPWPSSYTARLWRSNRRGAMSLGRIAIFRLVWFTRFGTTIKDVLLLHAYSCVIVDSVRLVWLIHSDSPSHPSPSPSTHTAGTTHHTKHHTQVHSSRIHRLLMDRLLHPAGSVSLMRDHHVAARPYQSHDSLWAISTTPG